MDRYAAEKKLLAYRREHPSQILLLLSTKPGSSGADIALTKPLNREDLKAAMSGAALKLEQEATSHELGQAGQKKRSSGATNRSPLEVNTASPEQRTKANGSESQPFRAAESLATTDRHALVGTAQDIDPDNYRTRRDAEYDPEQYLQGILERAFRLDDDSKQAFCLTTPRGAICAKPDGTAVVGFESHYLRALSVIPLCESSMSLNLDENAPPHEEGSETVGKDRLLWKLALWASRGRVPLGTDLDARVMLQQWPNMTRLQLFPDAMRICALLIQQPCSLLETARILAIPQRNVFAFFSAARAIGVAETAASRAHMPGPVVDLRQSPQRSLFKRIIGHLRREFSSDRNPVRYG